jgi:heme oxygenase
MTDHTIASENQPMPIMARLKKETKAAHKFLESLPYFKTLMDHRLPLECYVAQLRALAIIHGVMESEIAVSNDDRVSAVWNDGLKKLSLLEKDLEFFKPRTSSDFPIVVEAAMMMTGKIRMRRIENPVTLLGYLYVFEGSTLGNSMHRPDISTTFHLQDLVGCRYYSSYQDQLLDNWKRFTEKMNRAMDDPSIHNAVINAAFEAFDGLGILYQSLYPLKTGTNSTHATRINPEAGNHPIPDDEREIQAALRASDRGWREFTYYELRYGQRGRRFSDSDTCWLATLTCLDQDGVNKQVGWIGRVLATRGMPQIMLERTLRYLHEELTVSVPDKAPATDKLLKAAQMLCEQRTQQIPEKEFRRMASEFEMRVGAELSGMYNDTGQLLLSSVADEKNGMKGAVSALQAWMTDPCRFPEQ